MTQRLILLTFTFTIFCAATFAQDAPVPATPPNTPAQPVVIVRDLQFGSANYRTWIHDEDADDALNLRGQSMTSPGIRWARLGFSIADLNVRPNQVKIDWFPVSFYVFPITRTGTFTRDVPAAPPGNAQPAGTAAVPANTTTFKFKEFGMYGVITANANHIFDFKSNPFKTENERAGVGIFWTNKSDIRYREGKMTRVSVKTHAIEVAHSLGGGSPTWYLSFTHFFQNTRFLQQ